MLEQKAENDENNPLVKVQQEDKLDEYNKVLQEALNKSKIVIFVVCSEAFLAGSMYPIIVLYIQSFSPETTTSFISMLMFAGLIYYAFSSVIYTSLCDKYGHDKLFIIALFFGLFGLLFKSFAQNIWIYLIGHFVNKFPVISIGFAYIPKILPHKYAVRYCALLWTITATIYLLGPVTGSIIANYMNYRAVYYANSIYHFICFLIAIIFLRYDLQISFHVIICYQLIYPLLNVSKWFNEIFTRSTDKYWYFR